MYVAYGLRISSEVLLPMLRKDDIGGTPDLTIVVDPSLPVPKDRSQEWGHATRREAIYFRPSVGSFRITNGKAIAVRILEGSDLYELARVLLGIPMGCLLDQRGLRVMHASGVSIEGQAALFLGTSNSGKSTLAAQLLAGGYPVLTEDIAAIDCRESISLVTPAFPWLKLSCEAYKKIELPERTLISLKTDGRGRFGYDLTEDQFCSTATPLKHCYLLEWGEQTEVERIPGSSALSRVIPQIFHPPSQNRKDRKGEFESLMTFIRRIPLYRLTRPKSFDRIEECNGLIERHMS